MSTVVELLNSLEAGDPQPAWDPGGLCQLYEQKKEHAKAVPLFREALQTDG